MTKEYQKQYDLGVITPDLPWPDAHGACLFSTERYLNHLAGNGNRARFAELTRGVVLPEQLAESLQRKSADCVWQLGNLPAGNLAVYLPLGGKGRLIGSKFAAMLSRQLPVPGIIEGEWGAVNLGHEMIARHTPLTVQGDSLNTREKYEVQRYVEQSNDTYVSLLRKYFSDCMHQAHDAAYGRGLYWFLLDDQQGTGLTREVALNLSRLAVQKTGVEDINILDYTNLAPNWDHVPGYCVRETLKEAGLKRADVAAAEGYILRGGYDNGVGEGIELIQRPLSGHKMEREKTLDLSGMVEGFNAEFEDLF